MNAPISALFPIVKIISLRSQESSLPHRRMAQFHKICREAISAIDLSAKFPDELRQPLEYKEVNYYTDTILAADSPTNLLLSIEDILPSLSYFALPNEIIFEHIRPLYNGIMSILEGLSDIPDPWHSELDVFARGVRDFLFEDGQPIKQFIALADRVIEASSAHKTGEADAKMFTFTTYYREHQTEIHKGFAYIYGILLDTKNRIENHMKPQADKIIENTCSALIRRLTD